VQTQVEGVNDGTLDQSEAWGSNCKTCPMSWEDEQTGSSRVTFIHRVLQLAQADRRIKHYDTSMPGTIV